MAGFMLASLALVASLSGHERAKSVLESNVGRFMLRRLVHAMWGWFVASLVALFAAALPDVWGESIFLVALGICIGLSLLGFFAFTRFFGRFTIHKYWEP